MLEKRETVTKKEIKVDKKLNLYPNCDISVWQRTCEEEITIPIFGTVTGMIPKWLNGFLLRNGPGSMQVGDQKYEHVFDGDALIHK